MTSQRSYSGDAASDAGHGVEAPAESAEDLQKWLADPANYRPADTSLTHAARAEPPKGYAVAPKEIWLQLHGECDEDDLDKPVDYIGSDDVSWCWEQIHNTDVRYVRADFAAATTDAPLWNAYAEGRADEREEAESAAHPAEHRALLECADAFERSADWLDTGALTGSQRTHPLVGTLDYRTAAIAIRRLVALSSPSPAREEAGEDARRLDWLEANKDDVFHNADGSWTACRAPHSAVTRVTLRAAIDSAIEQMNKESK
jgi:hypothetical protein